MVLSWLLHLFLVGVAGLANLVIPLPKPTLPSPGMVIEDYLNVRTTVAAAVYVDRREVRRVTGVLSSVKLVREEILESSATSLRARLTFVELRASGKLNGQLFVAPMPPLEKKSFLLERTNGKLLAGHEDGSPLSKQENDGIRTMASNFGLTQTFAGPLTVGHKLTDLESRELAPKAGIWTQGAAVVPIGQRTGPNGEQAVFSVIGKSSSNVSDLDAITDGAGSLVVDLDGLGVELVMHGVGMLEEVKTVNHRREETRGVLTVVARVGSRRVTAAAPEPAATAPSR